jgi:hypothetical protein
VANVDDARREVDVAPAEREQFGEAHPGEDRGDVVSTPTNAAT